MKITSLFVLLFAFVVGSASPREASAAPWDNKGWVKLGERDVDRRVDKDRISVGRAEGRFTRLTLVVEKSDLELLDFEVTFANGERFNPRVQHRFREDSRTRVIDLPGDERVIKTIDLKYRNTPGGGRARVEVWGWKSDDARGRGDGPGRGDRADGPGPGPRGAPWRFESNGWQMLGERAINGRVDKERITVGRYKGRFSRMTMVVYDSDLELLDFEVKFARGPTWHPEVRHVFREGERSRVIDFPGDERQIKFIELKFRNLPGGGRGKVQVWAQ